MNTVVLTSGPRGSGKTTFTKRITSEKPEIISVIRDEIFIEVYESVLLCPYTDDPTIGYHAVMQKVKHHMHQQKDSTIILDHFTGFSWQRKLMIERLREDGADCVLCLYFLIPLETCIKWFMKKEDINGFSKHSVVWDYNLFYEKSSDIEEDGFDKVIYIDPRQLYFSSIPIL
ncbi:ATP-binding protein [Candidatus Parcubacteria bacterium]|nr:ATP-binding protein [Candidatus Parcubacteria bacterium]